MTRSLRSALLGAALLLVPAAAAPSAQAASHSATASGGAVSATVTWQKTSRDGASKVHVSIARGGVEVTSDDPQPKCEAFCWEPIAEPPVNVQDLNADGEPEVLVDLYSGGAHCCSMLLIYGFDPAVGKYRRLRRDFGNPGYTLRDADGDGRTEIFTEDDRFSYLFGSYLESARPLMILRYDGRRTVDVTREFPAEVERHSKRILRLYKQLRREKDLDLRGVLAAWQADNYLIGPDAAAQGWEYLKVAQRRGELKRTGANGGVTNGRYLKKLRSYLKKFGYV
jgi:hypothetical protein